MEGSNIQVWVEQNPVVAFSAILIFSIALFLFTRNILARGLIHLASRTKTKVDDILLKHLRPYRISWLAPLMAIYAFAYLLPDYASVIKKVALFLILWVSVFTIISLINALNEIYESKPNFTGVSIQSYLDITKILFIIVAIILSISLLSGESPLVLLTGLGASLLCCY
jgi:miniconductance mechanosensitive channel